MAKAANTKSSSKKPRDLAGIDLNALKVFDVVMEDRNLTRAATRLGMTVPKVSRTIDKFEEQLGAELFVTHGRGVTPTKEATEIYHVVRQALDQLMAGLTKEKTFDPATASRIFTIDIPVGGDCVIAPSLLEYAQKEAPGVRFHILSERAAMLNEQLRSGETELSIDYEVGANNELSHELLYQDPFYLIARKGHPVLGSKKALTVETFQTLQHAGLTWTRKRGDSPIATRLNRARVNRNFQFLASTLGAMPWVVASSDYVATVSERVARRFARHFPIELHPLPFDIAPIPIYSVWHSRLDDDPAHQWLRKAIRTACERI